MEKKIKIIELLYKIANGEAPRKIKVTGNTYEFDDELNFYYTKKDYMGIALGGVSGEINLIANAFNDIVEILDEDEFEDIRELGIPEIDTVENERICRAEYKINALIKNQKKIIERLNNQGNN